MGARRLGMPHAQILDVVTLLKSSMLEYFLGTPATAVGVLQGIFPNANIRAQSSHELIVVVRWMALKTQALGVLLALTLSFLTVYRWASESSMVRNGINSCEGLPRG